mmetsp:Transcript_12650/g.35297  ORF Transcript_12650/g.35297 Transcript_12650/m.35297 type:complete len:207 (+) Transcript_12650:363-983(+)
MKRQVLLRQIQYLFSNLPASKSLTSGLLPSLLFLFAESPSIPQVAVPLAKPHGFEKGDDYKLSLALDHYNFHTSWMRVINGKKASVSIPMVHVNLVHAGEEVTSFRAKVVPLPQEYSNTHAESINHFKNQTHWPKLLVVKYEWEERDLVRLDAGIAAITLLGVVVGAYLMAKIVSKSKGELEEFVNDISSEDGLSLAARREMIKGE